MQDQWTLRRLTLNLGLRYDYFNAYVPEQSLDRRSVRAGAQLRQGRVRAVLEGHQPADGGGLRSCSATAGPAIKVNVGRYVAADIYTQARANNPVTRAVLNATRTWTDSNGNFAPDCDLTNPNAQNLSGQRRRRLRRAQQRQLRQEQSECDDLRSPIR